MTREDEDAAADVRTSAFIAWLGRMAHRYGGTVHDHELHRTWDWGQALCREQYGADSSRWPDSPTADDVRRARAWEQEDDWPAWATRLEPIR